ncbi:glutathione S-transferase family protein [Salaquimonas pukyongi]|uniref:glutathione S-transferase family protein n=1 Tax=Salaquimonas pukyongi TaxID=2712698 RepID=UPI00096BC79D|nr:glutathione S-transferase [Salaquimonas pukyongi]
MADYTLHCFVESGNAYKAALMLQLTGCDWQAEWVDFFNGGHRTPEYRALNEMGEVPVLVDHGEDDLVLSQSGVILYHLAKKTGKFKPETAQEEREVLRWILFDNHKLTGNLSIWRFLSRFMNKGGDPEAEFLKGRTIAALKVAERHLASHDWLASDRPTIADISACGYLFWPDHVDLDWSQFPSINAWLKRIQSLENWAAPEDIVPSGPRSA